MLLPISCKREAKNSKPPGHVPAATGNPKMSGTAGSFINEVFLWRSNLSIWWWWSGGSECQERRPFAAKGASQTITACLQKVDIIRFPETAPLTSQDASQKLVRTAPDHLSTPPGHLSEQPPGHFSKRLPAISPNAFRPFLQTPSGHFSKQLFL